MVAFVHRDGRGGRAFLGRNRVEARLILLESPRRVLDPSASGLGGGVKGGSLRPQRKDHSLVFGGRQVQRMLVCSCAGLFYCFLNVSEGDQHHFFLDVGGEAIPNGG